jgi:DNA-directed RNA polymerase subunit RPC12/RpoP
VREQSYKIELFVFPDGTSVEMIVFDADRRCDACAPAPTAPRTQTANATAGAPAPCRVPPPPREDPDAHTCPVCGSRLVYPVDWERSGDAAWTLQLRCPECETRREVTLGRASVEHINRELYHGAQAMAHEAERLTRRNFEDEAERIVAALERDLIQPMDF